MLQIRGISPLVLIGGMFYVAALKTWSVLFLLLLISSLDELRELFGKNKIILRGNKGFCHNLGGSIPPFGHIKEWCILCNGSILRLINIVLKKI